MDGEFQLWDHQAESVAKLRDAVRRGKKRIVLQAPCGAGKTEIATEVTKSTRTKGNFAAFTVPLIGLIDQTVGRFELRGCAAEEIGVMQAKHDRTNERAPIQVCSVQTLASRKVFPLANVALIDECHLQHDIVYKWMKACPDLIFIGLSATPWARGMADFWEELIVVETIQGLIDKGVLSPFRTFCPAQRPNLDAVSIVAGDYNEGQLSEVMQETRLVADVVQTWLDKAAGRPTLVFCVDRAHAATVTNQFDGAGVRAKYVDAFTDTDDRAAYINELKTGETQVVVSIGTMTTGVDIPWVSCVQYVRPTRSKMLFVQSISRGLRAYPGKADCLILDHSMTSNNLGQVTDIGEPGLLPKKKPKSAVSRETPEPPRARECPECHYMVPPRIRRCPECGHMSATFSAVTYEEGELVEMGLSPKAKAQAKLNREWTPEQKEIFFGELKGFCEEKGYAPGWSANKYKDRFGVWPDRYKHVLPLRPSFGTLSWIRNGQRAYAQKMRAREAAHG